MRRRERKERWREKGRRGVVSKGGRKEEEGGKRKEGEIKLNEGGREGRNNERKEGREGTQERGGRARVFWVIYTTFRSIHNGKAVLQWR